MKLIDKDKLVAEINKEIHSLIEKSQKTQKPQFTLMGKIDALEDLLHFIDTLEVKEVDINKEISQFIDTYFGKATIGHKLSLRRTAKYFYELGLNTRKGE